MFISLEKSLWMYGIPVLGPFDIGITLLGENLIIFTCFPGNTVCRSSIFPSCFIQIYKAFVLYYPQ